MADTNTADGTADDEAGPGARPGLARPLVIGLVLALALGGGGFFVAWSGLLPFGGSPAERPSAQAGPIPDIAFVPIDPLAIGLGPGARYHHLRFSAELEVERAHRGDVALLMPRIRDVLNSYLRAVDLADLENPASLLRLRAQMLRRVQIVTGEGRVRDLLVTEFVLN